MRIWTSDKYKAKKCRLHAWSTSSFKHFINQKDTVLVISAVIIWLHILSLCVNLETEWWQVRPCNGVIIGSRKQTIPASSLLLRTLVWLLLNSDQKPSDSFPFFLQHVKVSIWTKVTTWSHPNTRYSKFCISLVLFI